MGVLEEPARLAGLGVDRRNPARPCIVERPPLRTIIVGRGIAHWRIDEPEILVGAHHPPAVGRAARIGLTRRRLALPVEATDVERPGEFTGHRIEAADHAGGLAPILAICHPAADHHLAADDRRCGGDEIIAGLHLAHAGQQRNLAILAEIGAALPCGGVDREHPRVDRRGDDARRAGAGGIGRAIIGHAATAAAIARALPGNLGIEAPAALAGRRVDRDHLVDAGADIGGVADDDRHRLERGERPLRADAGAEHPGLFEPGDIAGSDLVEPRETRAPLVTAENGPFGACAPVAGGQRCPGQRRLPLGIGRISGRRVVAVQPQAEDDRQDEAPTQ